MKTMTITTTTITKTTKIVVIPDSIQTVEDLQTYWNSFTEPAISVNARGEG